MRVLSLKGIMNIEELPSMKIMYRVKWKLNNIISQSCQYFKLSMKLVSVLNSHKTSGMDTISIFFPSLFRFCDLKDLVRWKFNEKKNYTIQIHVQHVWIIYLWLPNLEFNTGKCGFWDEMVCGTMDGFNEHYPQSSSIKTLSIDKVSAN